MGKWVGSVFPIWDVIICWHIPTQPQENTPLVNMHTAVYWRHRWVSFYAQLPKIVKYVHASTVGQYLVKATIVTILLLNNNFKIILMVDWLVIGQKVSVSATLMYVNSLSGYDLSSWTLYGSTSHTHHHHRFWWKWIIFYGENVFCFSLWCLPAALPQLSV